MHPPLYRPHPLCEEVVQNLVRCHEDNSFAKFLGVCNGQKYALDDCFRMEKEVRRRELRAENNLKTELMEKAYIATMNEINEKRKKSSSASP